MSSERPQTDDTVTYLGIDVGTSATKAVIISGDGTVVARSRVTHPAARGVGPGRADAAAWRSSVTAAVRELAPHTSHVRGVGLDTHCPTAMLLDAEGQPLTAGITWDHPGLAEPTEQMIAVLDPAERRLVGNHLKPATAMGAAYHLFRALDPDTTSTAATFGFVGTWLGQWLTGERAIDPTQASYTGLLASTDGTCRWLETALHRLGIPLHQLPPVRPSLSVLGPLLPAAAATLGLREGIPVIVGSGDTPAASYALGAEPGGRPLLIMGTTHVVSNALAVPDHRARALQRADVRTGRWLINGVINGGDALADGAERLGYGRGRHGGRRADRHRVQRRTSHMDTAPVFIPHTRPERGPLWFAEPRTALLGDIADTAAAVRRPRRRRRGAVRGPDDHRVLHRRSNNEPCTSAALSGSTRKCRNCSRTSWTGTSWSSTKATSPPSALPAMCAEVLTAHVIAPPAARRVQPRPQWRDAVDRRWQQYRREWSVVTATAPLTTLDEAAVTAPPLAIPTPAAPLPRTLTRSSRP